MNEGKRNGIAVFIVLLILIFVFFAMFGDRIGFTKTFHENLFGIGFSKLRGENTVLDTQSYQPIKDYSWCISKEITVDKDDREKPVRDRIVGWDSRGCCIREVSGFDCFLKKDVILRYCYTSNLGGEILYAKIDDYYLLNPNYYKTILNNIDKYEIENKICSSEVYPEEMINEKI